MCSSSFVMTFDDEVVGMALSENRHWGLTGYSESAAGHRYAATSGNLTCILDYHDNLKCQFHFVRDPPFFSASFKYGANDPRTALIRSYSRRKKRGTP